MRHGRTYAQFDTGSHGYTWTVDIVQATFGVAHHFDLARELHRRGHLRRIYSTFPWQRLKREGLTSRLVETYSWVTVSELLLSRLHLLPPQIGFAISIKLPVLFDRWIARRIPPCDALISLSRTCLDAGRLVQSQGGFFLCDRGCTHKRYQVRVVDEEHRLWSHPPVPEDEGDIAREELIYRESDAIVVPSRLARDSFIEHGYAREKVHVIPYGVRLDTFAEVGEPPSGPGARFEVLYVGSITLRKGIPYLLQAFARLRHPNKRLRLIGHLPADVKSLLATLPQRDVEFLGIVPQANLPTYMSASHVFVLPSIEDGFGLVVPQAMACGCPAIVSANAGASDMIEDGVNGFTFPARSVDTLSERLQQIADDPALRRRLSEAALLTVRNLGGWRDYGDRWEVLLQTLLHEKGAKHLTPASLG